MSNSPEYLEKARRGLILLLKQIKPELQHASEDELRDALENLSNAERDKIIERRFPTDTPIYKSAPDTTPRDSDWTVD